MSHNITIAFRPRDPAHIIAIDTVGNVLHVNIGPEGIEYKVRYWLDGKRTDEWFFDFELASKQ